MAPNRCSQLGALCVMILGSSVPGSVHGVIGPTTDAILANFPYAVHVEYQDSSEPVSYVGLVLSKYFVLTSDLFRTSYVEDGKVFSGAINSRTDAAGHRVVRAYNNDLLTVLRVCPRFETFTAIDLNEAGVYDFTSGNETGKVLFFNRQDWKLQYREEPVLTDDACVADNNAATAVLANYDKDNMTCTKFDDSANGCGYMYGPEDTSKSTFPALIVCDKPVALAWNFKCTFDATHVNIPYRGVGVYAKIFRQKDFITLYAVEV